MLSIPIKVLSSIVESFNISLPLVNSPFKEGIDTFFRVEDRNTLSAEISSSNGKLKFKRELLLNELYALLIDFNLGKFISVLPYPRFEKASPPDIVVSSGKVVPFIVLLLNQPTLVILSISIFVLSSILEYENTSVPVEPSPFKDIISTLIKFALINAFLPVIFVKLLKVAS